MRAKAPLVWAQHTMSEGSQNELSGFTKRTNRVYAFLGNLRRPSLPVFSLIVINGIIGLRGIGGGGNSGANPF